MPTIGTGDVYPNPQRYWKFLKETLIDVFNQTPKTADDLIKNLQRELQAAGPAERLLFFHAEPLSVAKDLTGTQTLTDQMYRDYDGLIHSLNWTP